MNDTAANPTISVIIVTWNGKRYALECIESLHKHPPEVPIEIIVVDNASTDGTPEAIRAEFPDVRLVENGANLGFAKANNIGAALSRGKYIALINSDVVVFAGCLDKMLAVMEAAPDIGIIGPAMVCPNGGFGPSVMRLPTVWNAFCSALALSSIFPNSRFFGGYSIKKAPGTVQDVQVVTGWFWMVSRTALQLVGGLDERFFMFGEDIDWCHRFLKAGWRVVYCGDAESLHYGGASSAETPARFYVEMRRANRQYFYKHHGVPGAIGYTLVIGIHELARIAGYSLSYCYDGQKRLEAAAKIRRSLSCLNWLAGGSSWTPKQVDQ